jgi:general secretion pathway protein E
MEYMEEQTKSYPHFLAEKLGTSLLEKSEHLSFQQVNKKLKEDKKWTAKTQKIAAEYLGIPLAKKPNSDIDPKVIEPITFSLAKNYLCLPLEDTLDGTVIAIASPEKSLALVDDYQRFTGKNTIVTYMEEDDLLALINKTWDKGSTKASDVMNQVEEESDLASMAAELNEPEDLLDSEHDAPIIKLINTILTQAIKDGASDIHIEPFEKQVSVRFRVDGVMHTVVTPSRKLHAAMSARLKIMAELDIAEKRLPQDGRIKIRLAGKETDIRVSTLPTQHGERIVLRILGQQEGIRKLNNIGLREPQLSEMMKFFTQPNGILFVAGPTGSGKTSTLYAGLQEINTPDKNIVTIEDPVEYALEGLGQIPVNTKIGMTFAAGLRSILRQDPDVVVVGETRDLETAEIAIESSLTGHLVLSTIHTNSAPATVTRLLEMGIEPFLVASSLRGVVAQRMIRLLDPETKVPRKLDAETMKLFEALPAAVRPKDITLFDASPTPECPTGYRGRSGIFEMLTVTDNIRQLIQAKASDAEIQKIAEKEGMLTLYQEGLLRAAKGETTLEEVLRVTLTQ